MDGKKVEVISSGKRGVVEGIRTDGGVIKYAVRYDSGNVYNVLAKNIRVISEQLHTDTPENECKHLQTGNNIPVLLLPAPCEHPELKHVATTTEGIYARCAVCGKRITVLESGDTGAGNRHLHRITREETAFWSFSEMTANTPPSYFPTIFPDSDERLILADAFEMACRAYGFTGRRVFRAGVFRPPYQQYLPAPLDVTCDEGRELYPVVPWPLNFGVLAAYRVIRTLADHDGVAIFCDWKPLKIRGIAYTGSIERAEKHVVRVWLDKRRMRRIPMQDRKYALVASVADVKAWADWIELIYPGIIQEYRNGWLHSILTSDNNNTENSPAEAVAA